MFFKRAFSSKEIRLVFDDSKYFNKNYLFTNKSCGMLGLDYIKCPQDIIISAHNSVGNGEKLLSHILRGENDDNLIKNMDTLSDILCTTIDMAELLRNVGPPDWATHSNESYNILSSYIGHLNTHEQLYKVMVRVL
jgi:intermediate peptidase